MPEILEVELTRRSVERLVGRRFGAVLATDDLVVGDGVGTVIPGSLIVGLERRGKLLVVHTDRVDLGIHLGMTGKLLIDGVDSLGPLAYGSRSTAAKWDRWVIELDDASTLRLHDPRRLGRIWLDPDIDALGPDALTLTPGRLTRALAGRRAPIKAVLLDQHAVAGLGNMLIDEVLWRVGIDPHRPANEVTPDEVVRLNRSIRSRLPVMMERGGSHTGTLAPAIRQSLGPCPRCGHELARSKVGTRTTVWCPGHQH